MKKKLFQSEGRDSQKLVRRADINIGQHINSMFRIRAKITDPSASGRVLTGEDVKLELIDEPERFL